MHIFLNNTLLYSNHANMHALLLLILVKASCRLDKCTLFDNSALLCTSCNVMAHPPVIWTGYYQFRQAEI